MPRPPAALLIAMFCVLTSSACADAGKPLTRIAFGSCARENKPQPIWHTIADAKPDLFLFIGDNIYGDTEDMAVLKAKWDKLAAMPGYQRLRKQCPILATWDDHDYGKNDAGTEYKMKAQSQQVFLDHFGEPADSPRRKREGVYDAKVFGPQGKRVQVVLLDTRYHRSPIKRRAGGRPPGRGPYLPDDNPKLTMLGDAQWKWLEAQLKQPAELRIIASSIQFVSEKHGWEMWANHPHERQRMLQLIAKTRAEGVVFISGDRHKAEISKLMPDVKLSGVTYPIYDITSSSLNQPSGGALDEPNPHRVVSKTMFGQINFGTIEIDWSKDDPAVTFAIRDAEGKGRIVESIVLSAIQAPTNQ